MRKITFIKTFATFLIVWILSMVTFQLMAQGLPESPSPLDPTSKTSLGEWWTFIYTLVAPVATYLVTRFWPALSKSDLVIKAFVTAIVVLIAFIVAVGAKISTVTVLLAVVGLIGQKFLYDNVLKPFKLLTSKKARNYK